MPFGESQIDQRTGDWNSRYTFSGKERDEETGYSYFGARYYDADLSIWLSRDPLAHLYPHQSPYVYCSNNPIARVDPNGMADDLVITGTDAEEAKSQLQNKTNLQLGFGENGKIEITGGKAKNAVDRQLKKIIKDDKISVNIIAENSNSFTTRDGEAITTENGGAYGGNAMTETGVNAEQFVSPQMLEAFDLSVGDTKVGTTMLHEVAEAYFGGKIALESKDASPREGKAGSTYKQAYNMANSVALGSRGRIIERFPTFKIGRNGFGHPSITPTGYVDIHRGYRRTR